ncbi:MAG: response regulator [Deltaproteobacteria bacterium]|nr:response regulator [Deltaproteobacteria bacterium]
MTAQPAEVSGGTAPVYEIELDLGGWKVSNTREVPRFADDLVRALPSMKEDLCRSGEGCGFGRELEKGTNFAQVIEHVILALIRLAKGKQGPYSGSTRRLNEEQVYLIQYSAPDFLTGRLAAILAIDLVKRLIAGEPAAGDHYGRFLKQPRSYFDEGAIAGAIQKTGEPVGVIEALKWEPAELLRKPKERVLAAGQLEVIKKMLKDIRHQLESITAAWRESFLAYGGTYGATIIDKLELLNVDRYFIPLVGGNLPKVMGEVKRAAQLIDSYNIPLGFVIHSLWLYKNKLLSSVMDKYKYQDTAPVDRFIKDFEDLYQIIMQNVTEGFVRSEPLSSPGSSGEFRRFIELDPQKGRILVIDDDEMIRRIVTDVLELHGYRTLLSQSGAQALELLAESREAIRLVVLDIYRPDDLNVKELYERIKALCGDVKFIVTSGLSVPPELESFLHAESISFLKKPFTVNYLMNKVESLLC